MLVDVMRADNVSSVSAKPNHLIEKDRNKLIHFLKAMGVVYHDHFLKSGDIIVISIVN